MIFGGFLDTDLTNQCYIIDHNRQSIQKMKKPNAQRNDGNDSGARAARERPAGESESEAVEPAEVPAADTEYVT